MGLFKRRTKLAGHLDRLDHTVAGWVLDPSDPHRTIAVTLVQDGEVLHHWNALLFRSDVARMHGSGRHGFSLDLDKVNGVREGAMLEVFADGPGGKRLGKGIFSPAPRAARGDDGWLFLQNDSNDVNARISGTSEIDVSV